MYCRLFLPALSGVVVQEGKTDATLRVMELRAALALYEKKNNRLPATLDELVPDILPAVPLDPFSEKPLHYALLRIEQAARLQQQGPRWKIWSVGENLKDDGGATDPAPWGGPDYVFFSTAETNEQRRRDMKPPPPAVPPAGQAARPRTRTEADFKNDIAALTNVMRKDEDPIQKNLSWYVLKQGLVVADAEKRQLACITELLGEPDFVVNSIAFGNDKVWVGTNKGLFAWDRKDMFWTRFAVDGKFVDLPVKELSLDDGGNVLVSIEQAGKPRKFGYDVKTGVWAERP